MQKAGILRTMAASALFTERVYEVVARIPYGRVTTYGDVARADAWRHVQLEDDAGLLGAWLVPRSEELPPPAPEPIDAGATDG